MLGTDEIIKATNIDPIFTPFLAGILNTVLPENVSKDSTRLIQKSIDQLEHNYS